MADVDFSSLVFVDGGGFLVRSDGPIQSIEGFNGKKIGVIAGTTTEQRLALTLKQQKHRRDGRPRARRSRRPRDARGRHARRVRRRQDQARRPRGDREGPEHARAARRGPVVEPYAFALPRGDSSFRLEVNRALTQVYVSGDIDGIFLRSMGKLGRPTGVLAAMYLLNAIPD